MPLTLLSSEIDLLLFHHSSLPSAQFTAVFGEKAGLNGDSTHPRSTSFFSNLFVSRHTQRRHRPLQVLALDQHIIRIKRRNREDRNPSFRQRLQKRRQHAGHRKRKGPSSFSAIHPRSTSALSGIRSSRQASSVPASSRQTTESSSRVRTTQKTPPSSAQAGMRASKANRHTASRSIRTRYFRL